MKVRKRAIASSTIALFSLVIGFVFFDVPEFSDTMEYSRGDVVHDSKITEVQETEKVYSPTHLSTPNPLKAIYMTSWVAGTLDWRDRMVKMIDETELNAIVIDIKDYSGKISFPMDDALILEVGSVEKRIGNIRDFIRILHEKDIYVIGRITVFQDPHFAKKYPEFAVQRLSDKSVWSDNKGLSYVDPGARAAWEYTTAIARGAYAEGFDELNFDYIRFPSDGALDEVYYPVSEERVVRSPTTGKAEIIEEFFAYLARELRGEGAVLSADLFGLTTTSTTDLNIGQVLERAEPYFDYSAPMVYPSHFEHSFIGFARPAEHPYEVVKYSLERGRDRLIAASSSPSKLRPWLQDFDLGATYTKEMVRAQLDAPCDAGLTSWMLWDAANLYTREALK